MKIGEPPSIGLCSYPRNGPHGIAHDSMFGPFVRLWQKQYRASLK